MCFNIGIIVGPILGGLLANPVETYPEIFGPGSWLGGKHGVGWMIEYPYALPNVVSAIALFLSLMVVILGLQETFETERNIFAPFTKVYTWLKKICSIREARHPEYRIIGSREHDEID